MFTKAGDRYQFDWIVHYWAAANHVNKCNSRDSANIKIEIIQTIFE